MDTINSPLESDLFDISDVDMAELGAMPDSVLGYLWQRVIDEALNPTGTPVAAFNSSL